MRATFLPISVALFAATMAAGVAAHGQSTVPASDGAARTIAMSLVGKHPRIEVHVEGVERPLSFVVDTAAGGGVLDAALAERLGLLDAKASEVSVTGASSTVRANRFTRSLRLTAGAFKWQAAMLAMNLAHIARDGDAPIDGIIGNDVLARFDLRFDLPAGTLTLTPPRNDGDGACIANALRERQGPLRNFAFVPATIAAGDTALELTAVVDTGASQTILNMAAARALGLTENDARLRVREDGTRGLTNTAVKTWLYDLPGFTVGNWTAGALEVRVADLPVFASLGQTDRPTMILGVDALRTARLDISAGAERICVSAARDVPASSSAAAAGS